MPEPAASLDENQKPKRRSKSKALTILLVVAIIALALCLALCLFLLQSPLFRPETAPSGGPAEAKNDPSSVWNKIKPSRELKWQACYGEFECSRLDLPMDWENPTEERVILGIIKLPAKQKDRNLPPVFINPGGPGSSGITELESRGHSLQDIIGHNHDLISFDPRGVGISTPRIDCGDLSGNPMIDWRPDIWDAYASIFKYSRTCEAALNETGILRHIGTASVARDMLEILRLTGHNKLRYWGFSYGSILGGVFAGLYPDRVERLVSDANVDYNSWFNGDHSEFDVDAHRMLEAFDYYCHKAGSKCAFYNNDETLEAIEKRRVGLMESLKKSPVIIPGRPAGPVIEPGRPADPGISFILTYGKLQSFLQSIYYSPFTKFPLLAEVYAVLEAMKMGEAPDPGGIWALIDSLGLLTPRDTEFDARLAIGCSDSEGVNISISEIEERMQNLSQLEPVSVESRLHCVGRTVMPKWRFTDASFKGDTAYPILYINNKVDHVTPLQSAFNNSKYFNNSVVLTQNSYGHCSQGHPSTCTNNIVHAYFQNGTLPKPGTECEPDVELFQNSNNTGAAEKSMVMWFKL